MPLKSQTIFSFKYNKPKTGDIFYRKVACPENCDNSVTVKDVFGNVRTCPKVIGGSSNCVPLSANTRINANVATDASGNLVKKYYTSNAEYLKARCKTYEQKSFHFTRNGSTLQANCCGNEAGYVSGNCKATVYKPNNTKYSVQGAVSAGERLNRLRYNTITRSSGLNRANCTSCTKYPPVNERNQLVKDSICVRPWKNGNKNSC